MTRKAVPHALPRAKSQEEIRIVLDALEEVWSKYPVMCLTQVVNRVAEMDTDNPATRIKYDISAVKDAEWIEKAKRYPY